MEIVQGFFQESRDFRLETTD